MTELSERLDDIESKWDSMLWPPYGARAEVAYLLDLARKQQAALERVEALAAKLDRFGGNTRRMNPTNHPGWEGKARDFERQAIAIRAALESKP